MCNGSYAGAANANRMTCTNSSACSNLRAQSGQSK